MSPDSIVKSRDPTSSPSELCDSTDGQVIILGLNGVVFPVVHTVLVVFFIFNVTAVSVYCSMYQHILH